MSQEPKYVRQIQQDKSEHEHWFFEAKKEAELEGCTFFRFSVYEEDDTIALVEGWEKYPLNQGEQRWSFR